jgi:hypothetical protein
VREPGEITGTYEIQQGTVNDANNNNYSIEYVVANLAINAEQPPPVESPVEPPPPTTSVEMPVEPLPPPPPPPPVITPVIETSPLLPDSSSGTGSGAMTSPGETGGTSDVGSTGSPSPLLNVDIALVIPLSNSGESSVDGGGGGASGQLGAGGISILLDFTPSGNFGSGVQNAVVTVSLPKATVTNGTGFSFELPARVRESLGTGVLQATLADGSSLPGWIQINPATQRFEAGAVPDGGLPLQVLIRSGTLQLLVLISERGG